MADSREQIIVQGARGDVDLSRSWEVDENSKGLDRLGFVFKAPVVTAVFSAVGAYIVNRFIPDLPANYYLPFIGATVASFFGASKYYDWSSAMAEYSIRHAKDSNNMKKAAVGWFGNKRVTNLLVQSERQPRRRQAGERHSNRLRRSRTSR